MSDSIVNTQTAARFLGVSEASVRRWSDSGVLVVQRSSPRGRRRYAKEDLIRFREQIGVTPQGSGGVAIGSVVLPLHSHLATFYDSEAGRLRLTIPFLRDGLRLGQPCFLVVTGRTRDMYLRALEQEGIAAQDAIDSGRLSILPGIGPRTEDALAVWEEGFWKAVNQGATILRVVGEMESERQAFESDQEMIAYEFAVNALTERFPCVVLCQYDVRQFDGMTILGALKAHPHLMGDDRLGDVLL